MTEINVTIKPSLDQLAAAFKGIDIRAALQRGIEKIAFGVERESKKVTPVRTGMLRASILTDIKPLWARVAPHVFYAGYVHEGTRYMKARPFMWWGLNSAISQFRDPVFEVEIKKEIDDKLGKIK
jgi:HK97 gp10 family phage protein